MSKARIIVAALSLSAAGLVGLVNHEGYTDKAIIPVPGDVPTIGFGTTDGVQMGDRTTPPEALKRALRDVNKFEGALKRCVTVPLAQNEYDAYVQLSYNIGERAFCTSTLVRVLNAGDYAGACRRIDDFVCGPATPQSAARPDEKCYSKNKPRKVIRGLAERRKAERALCES